MKKFLVLLIVVFFAFAGVACDRQSGQDNPQQSSDQSNAVPPVAAAESEESSTEKKRISARKLLENTNARMAIAYAFDKSFISDVVLGNGSAAVDFLVPQGLAISEDGVDFREAHPAGWHHFDLVKAKNYWKIAKQELQFEEVNVTFLAYDSAVSKRISEYIKTQLEENLSGLKIELDLQPYQKKVALSKSGEFDIEYSGWSPEYPDAATFLEIWSAKGAYNNSGYRSEQYDEMLTNAAQATDENARTATLQEAERLLLQDDCALVPLYQRGLAYLLSPHIDGVISHQFGGKFSYSKAVSDLDSDGRQLIRLIGAADILTLDCGMVTDDVSLDAMINVFEGLVSLDESGLVVPAGAERWEVSEDGTQYTFYLRKDAKWSNDQPVTAQDYVYAWQRLASPSTDARYQVMFEMAQIKNSAAVIAGDAPQEELGVVALDEYTLQVNLEKPLTYFLKLMFYPSFYPINQAFAESQAGRYGTSLQSTLYNGPYQMSTWKLGEGYSFSKNQNYWNADAVLNDGVTFSNVEDAMAGINAYEMGEVDCVRLSGEFVEQYIAHPNYQVRRDSALYYLVFNLRGQ